MENDVELTIAERYYRKGLEPAEKAIKNFLRDSPLVVHGGQAINAQLPNWLDRETRDWDIFTPEKAEDQAKQLEKKLDKRYGGDYFNVEAGIHPGTYRIRNKVTGEVIADITLHNKAVEFREIEGIRYATLGYHEEHIRETLEDPSAAFRHKKDRDALQRILIARKRGRRGRQGRERGKWRRRDPLNGAGFLSGLRG